MTKINNFQISDWAKIKRIDNTDSLQGNVEEKVWAISSSFFEVNWGEKNQTQRCNPANILYLTQHIFKFKDDNCYVICNIMMLEAI